MLNSTVVSECILERRRRFEQGIHHPLHVPDNATAIATGNQLESNRRIEEQCMTALSGVMVWRGYGRQLRGRPRISLAGFLTVKIMDELQGPGRLPAD
ncbi:MAG: hypothetical protein ACKOEO_15220 [Planctomycetaceae bacterium]